MAKQNGGGDPSRCECKSLAIFIDDVRSGWISDTNPVMILSWLNLYGGLYSIVTVETFQSSEVRYLQN